MKKSLLVLILLLLPAVSQAEQLWCGTSEAAQQAGALPDKAVTATCDGATDKCSLDINSTGGVPPVPTINATFAAADATAFGDIGAAYALGVDLPASTKVVILDNQTNGDVVVSMDAGVSDSFFMKGGDKLILPLAQAGLVTTAIVHLKDGTTVSTAGTFYIYSYK